MDERLVNIEVKLAYQEDLLETLNQVVIELRGEIDTLRRKVDTFEQQMREGNEDAADTPPPHY
jgi:SlyX protein